MSEKTWEELDAQRKQELAKIIESITQVREESKVAAKWWADQVRTGSSASVGDAKLDGVMAGFKALTGDRYKFSPEVIDKFEEELAREVEASIIEHERRYDEAYRNHSRDAASEWEWYVRLSVDYHPCSSLFDAATKAGMRDTSSFVFPCKTNMNIDRGKIEVQGGYGAERKVLWMSPEGVSYWSSEAMSRCVGSLLKLAGGAPKELSPSLRETAQGIESSRPKQHDKPAPEPECEYSQAECSRGMLDALDIGLALSGVKA